MWQIGAPVGSASTELRVVKYSIIIVVVNVGLYIAAASFIFGGRPYETVDAETSDIQSFPDSLETQNAISLLGEAPCYIKNPE